MKIPSLSAFLLVGVGMLLGGFIQSAKAQRTFGAQSACADSARYGFVMGRDFTSLLANPHLRLEVTETSDAVYFEWTTANQARLAELVEMGQYMQDAKRQLEAIGPWTEPDDVPQRTASLNIGEGRMP